MQAKNKHRYLFHSSTYSLILTTIFATSKNLLEFTNWKDFKIGIIIAMVNNCVIMTVLNKKLLFLDNLKPTTHYSIITISDSDFKLTHIGIARTSIIDNNGLITTITIPQVLYFPTLPVNALSIRKLSQ